jgi:chitinase
MRAYARRSVRFLPLLAAALGVSCSQYESSEPAPAPSESVGQTEQALVSSPVRLAYYAVWASATTPEPPGNVPWGKITHVNLAFAGISPSPYTAKFWTDFNRQDSEDTQALANAKALVAYRNCPSNPDTTNFTTCSGNFTNVKVMLVVGGWTLSYRFSDAVSTSANRSSFADSCVSLMNTVHADGVDFDWEYPTRLGSTSGDGACHEGTCQRSSDATNFTAFLDTLRRKSGMSGKKVTAALHANSSGDGNNIPYEFGKFFDGASCHNSSGAGTNCFDFVNLMTYDDHGTWEGTTNYNAPYSWVTSAMDYNRLQVGDANKGKLVMGIPFYGPMWSSVASNGTGVAGTGVGPVAYKDARTTYSSLTTYGSTTDRRKWIDGTVNGYYRPWFSYDDVTVVGSKTQWVADNNYGGAMWWAQGMDYNNELAAEILRRLPSGGGGTTTVDLVSDRDLYVRDGTYADTNFGTATQLVVKNSSTGYNRQSYLHFNISSIPVSTSAKLRVYVEGVSAAMSVQAYFDSTEDSWSETTTTWNNKPVNYVSADTQSLAAGYTGWVEFDVSPEMASESSCCSQVTFVLRDDAVQNQTATITSREGTTANRPILRVTY